jgi:hypothetical protein
MEIVLDTKYVEFLYIYTGAIYIRDAAEIHVGLHVIVKCPSLLPI